MSVIQGSPRAALLAAAVGAAFALCSSPSHAQPLTLPAALSGQKISLKFDSDPSVDVRLLAITHHEGGQDYVFLNDPVVPANNDWRLWELRLTNTATGAPVTVGPAQGTVFTANATVGFSGNPAFLFGWYGVQVDPQNSLAVFMLVELGATDQVSRWRVLVLRETSNQSYSLDEVDCPILYLVPPFSQRGAELEADALLRTRLMVPVTEPSSANASNLPFSVWPGINVPVSARDKTLVHGSSQTLQFSVMYDADTDDSAVAPGRMAFLGSEDPIGYHKMFRHQVLADASDTPRGEDFRYHWRHTYVPSFVDFTGQPSEGNNILNSAYPATVGCLLAQSDAFWYDAASYYRSWVENSGMVGVRYQNNTSLSSLRDPSILTVFNQILPALQGQQLYQRCLDHTLAWQVGLNNPFVATDKVFMQWHAYLQGGMGVRNPENPVTQTVDSGVQNIVNTALNTYGIRTSAYLYPFALDRNTGPNGWANGDFLANHPWAEVFDRSGAPIDPTKVLLDYGCPESQVWFGDHPITDLVNNFNFSGFYLDSMSGSGPRFAYDPPPTVGPASHPGHGGNYWANGRLTALSHIRNVIKALRAQDPDVFLLSESVEEYMTGVLDVTTVGEDLVPGRTLLQEDAILAAAGLPSQGTPWGASEWHPPLWHAVHHEWTPASTPAMALTNLGLNTGAQAAYPRTVGSVTYPGLSDNELIDVLCYTYGTFYASGSRPSAFPYFTDLDAPLVTYAAPGVIGINLGVDPNAVGFTIMNTLATYFGSQDVPYAGQFLLYGRMQRPLDVDYASAQVDRQAHPLAACNKTAPDHARMTYPLMEGSTAFSHAWFLNGLNTEAPRILHSLWTDGQGQLGLVLINWSRFPASFEGTFDPTLYGFGPTQSYNVNRLAHVAAGVVQPNLVGSFQGTITVHANNGTTGGQDLFVGLVPAHSVQVYTIN